MSLQRDDAFAFEAEDGAGLRAFRDGQSFFAVERGNSDLRAEGGLREGDGNIDVEIIALTFEDLVFFDVDHHIEIASRPRILTSLALAGQSQTRAGVNAGGNLYFELLLLLDSPLAAAGFAGVGDHSACAATLMTCTADREESLLESDLSRSAAKIAYDGRGAGGRPSPFAIGAVFEPGNDNLSFETGRRLFQRDLEVVAEIGAALWPSSTRTAPAEDVAEEIAENVLEAAEIRGRPRA